MKRTTAFVVLIGVVAAGCVTGPASPIDPSTASDGPEVPAIRLEPMMAGLAAPIFVAERDGLLYVAEQQGLVSPYPASSARRRSTGAAACISFSG